MSTRFTPLRLSAGDRPSDRLEVRLDSSHLAGMSDPEFDFGQLAIERLVLLCFFSSLLVNIENVFYFRDSLYLYALLFQNVGRHA